jgi:phage protein D
MTAAAPFQIARPLINVDGRDQASLSERLMALTTIETIGGLYRCEALFGNWGTRNNSIDFLFFDRRTLEFGKTFKVKMGTDVVFEGRIMGLEANYPDGSAPSMTVLAEDRLQDLRMTRRTRTFNDMSDADVFNRIAQDHGLTPDITLPGGTHRVLAQVNQSDLAFLRGRARAIDADLWVNGSTMVAKKRPNRASSPIELTYGRTLREFSALADLAMQRTHVVVSGWDVSGKSAIKHEAGASVISGELNGDTSGVSILESTIGERKEVLAHTVPFTTAEAQAEAEAVFKMTARRFVIGRGASEPDSNLRVGEFVDLKNLGPLFSGKYYLTEVRHVFDGRGIRTEFIAERPGIGQAQ